MEQNAQTTSGTTAAYWLDHVNRKHYPTLEQDIKTDVCVIGAGITGLTTAYCLANAGYQVTVIDDGRIGSGETGRTTAHLSNALDDRYYNLIRVHGLEYATLAAQSHTAAIQFIEAFVHQEKINCDFARVDGFLFADDNDPHGILQKEYDAAKKVGIQVELIKQNPEQHFQMKRCLKFPEQAQFNPIPYLKVMAEKIIAAGGAIYEDTRALTLDDDKKTVLTASCHTIKANAIVQATNVPINSSLSLFACQAANRTYVVCFAIPKDKLSLSLFWDINDPYHYVRIQPNHGQIAGLAADHDLLIVGGADHRTGTAPKENPFKSLEAWTKQHIPSVGRVLYQWSGQVIEPVDYLAFIGLNLKQKNTYIATGDSGNGITHGTLAGLLLTQLIEKESSQWKEVYEPKRQRSFIQVKDLVGHNLATLKSYMDHLMPSEIKSANDLKPGEGGILQQGKSKIALYRDPNNELHSFSALCPHLKALLKWNEIESSWDCPAHGSRFTAMGDVVNGPAYCKMECLQNSPPTEEQ